MGRLGVKRVLFAVGLIVAGLCTLVLRWPPRFQTDFSSLLNINVVDGWPVGRIMDKFSSVLTVVVKSSDMYDGADVATQIKDIIDTGDFSGLNLVNVAVPPRKIVEEIGQYKNVLVGDTYRKIMQSGDWQKITDLAVERVKTSIAPAMLPVSHDPFLVFTDYISEMGAGGDAWIPQNGFLWQYNNGYHFYMLPISVNMNNNDEMVDNVTRFSDKIHELSGADVEIYVTGVPAHTANMYAHSKVELGILAFVALIAVVILNYLLFRRFKNLLPVGLSLGVGFLSGAIALFLVFGTPHILVFVFGTSLIGLGIDYSFHFLHAAGRNGAAGVHRNILHSLITTLICFAPLVFSSIGLLRQISVFTIVGLVTIYVFIKLFFAHNTDAVRVVSQHRIAIRIRPWAIWGIFGIALIVCGFARMENNMATMYRPDAELLVADRVVAELNANNGGNILIVRGNNVQDVLETEEELRDCGVKFIGLGRFIPSLRRQTENLELITQLYKTQGGAIQRRLGLRHLPRIGESKLLAPWANESNFLDDLAHRFLITDGAGVYSIGQISIDTDITNDDMKIIAPAQLIQTQMSKYTNEVYVLLGACAVVLILILFVLYRWRAFKYLVPPVMGAVIAVAVLTIFGMPITFFHLLALFIVIGLGMDYAIFHINSSSDDELRPVFYSCLTSFIGFGLLSFTSFTLIAAMGMTLALGIGVSYVVSLCLFRNGAGRVPPNVGGTDCGNANDKSPHRIK